MIDGSMLDITCSPSQSISQLILTARPHSLSRCSRALYAYAHYPDLWKALVLTALSERHAAMPADQRCGGGGGWDLGFEARADRVILFTKPQEPRGPAAALPPLVEGDLRAADGGRWGLREVGC